MSRRILISIFILLFAFTPISYSQNIDYIRYQSPTILNYNELVVLGKNPVPGGEITDKVEKLFRTPLVSNEAYYSGKKPRRLVRPELGPILRLATWDIESTSALDALITTFTNSTKFSALIDTPRVPVGSEEYADAVTQRSVLAASDVVVLQQADIGMKRSGYRNSVKEIAQALGMNYAFGTEQIEVDPVSLGMKEEFIYDDNQVDEKLYQIFKVDPAKYLGLCGSAVLSRYPVKHVEVFPLKYQAYDWYYEEMQKAPVFQKIPRVGPNEVLEDKLLRNMKIGKRIFLRVDLSVPELPEQTLTVINVNLESHCQPRAREIQLAEILEYIKDIKHPVVLAGNFNSASGDLSQFTARTEIQRAATDPNVLASPLISVFVPGGVVINGIRYSVNFGKNYHNPTAGNVPLFVPNRVKGLFDKLEFYRFSDGGAFDFRGTPARSLDGKIAPLGNSNERMAGGFKTTFDTYQTIYNISGTFRLDWIFVKPVDLKHPFDNKGSYQFAPHFGATLKEMNTSLTSTISNHSPNVVDLPLGIPLIDEKIESSYIKPVKKAGMKG